MFDYLKERELEEAFRITTRRLHFPDGEHRSVSAYRLIWRWYDRALAYEFGPDKDEILNLTLKCAVEEKLPLDQALGCVLDFVVALGESEGLDYTDDNLPLFVAKESMQKFYDRKKN